MKSVDDGREITECVCANPSQRTEMLGEAASGLFEKAFSISSPQGQPTAKQVELVNLQLADPKLVTAWQKAN
jgi:hypothetical protein